MKTLTRQLKAKQQANETIFVPYIMAGAQGLDQLADEIQLLTEAGASAIELGIPFSDPVADGPIIQAAGLRALENNVTLQKIIQQLKKIETKTSLVIMTYFNPIFTYGLETFIHDLAETDVKGVIIPDLPHEHQELVAPLLKDSDISLIPLIALTTPKDRIPTLVESGEGFIYAVAVNGVTGTGRNYQETLDEHLAYIQKVSDKPVLAGFGVSSKEHVERFRKSCAGVIVGSKIVQLLSEGKRAEVSTFIKEAVSK
ncbi:tryptophan synthase, alpha subunit [Enterococcus haemoperoxidus ATCC BAA-382]|uniref:Tryptophan synthase alpha chain n=1 Tax=Enterococcus haemoperoxidus ATCC BAA-382 TaxID=1158608 RepID=R2SWG2_9ENTE|nr:tryptophan synthase subunit alpha [Enterococcus haemoperoxidus]EOH97146.1 tryptophan synthase, alpha subunit [Enterococcus haemoperoxidus ATCC BAA-382]EOT59959.1 tryptophan synthase, alpha subunit [Enterococcus haemoperoxidus ATCC BAA-382]